MKQYGVVFLHNPGFQKSRSLNFKYLSYWRNGLNTQIPVTSVRVLEKRKIVESMEGNAKLSNKVWYRAPRQGEKSVLTSVFRIEKV